MAGVSKQDAERSQPAGVEAQELNGSPRRQRPARPVNKGLTTAVLVDSTPRDVVSGARGNGAGMFSGRDADMERKPTRTDGSTSHADQSISKRVTRSRSADHQHRVQQEARHPRGLSGESSAQLE